MAIQDKRENKSKKVEKNGEMKRYYLEQRITLH